MDRYEGTSNAVPADGSLHGCRRRHVGAAGDLGHSPGLPISIRVCVSRINAVRINAVLISLDFPWIGNERSPNVWKSRQLASA